MKFRFSFEGDTIRDERGRVVEVDRRALDTDWPSLWELFKDMSAFAGEHPGVKFLVADDPGIVGKAPREPRFGWVAFSGDTLLKTWTIPFGKAQATQGELPENFRVLLRTAETRAKLVSAVIGPR